ncbi:hypothetical protein [Aquimarina algiphila]|uniref:Uncharacterized protein n=1 Tax=Aquimarina algiphila TaxID=2047982 RepID=A0A554VNP5_9FLAO|nr:hypothetical protein [Aquimarina algiphila]TSE09997.1 hypothetical protein FOF46_06765 [Aquimarina algiphila]
MRNVSFFSKAIFLFLFTMILTNCSSTDLNEEVGIKTVESTKENIEIVNEEEVPTQKIDKGDIKPPTQG